MNIFKHTTREKGFTLVEMVVSIALFTVVAMVAIGALLKIIDANKKSQSLKTTITNLNFALDSISREMRVGTNFNCYNNGNATVPSQITSSSGCPSGAEGQWIIAFNSSDTCTVAGVERKLIHAYRYDGFILDKAEQTECNGPLDFYPIISGSSPDRPEPDVDVPIFFTLSRVKVVTQTTVPTSPAPLPYIQLHLAGYAGVKTPSYFDVQTTVSQRIPD